ncbi:MAG: YdaU family protein [Chitinispirillales bacterium]|jgi:uncharacterized protein YdaU (DUF1376 family)|nr:YdaU family protein [Chitinispirillales bacterium]
MAKSPAVLIYTQDFLVGTMTMTNEQVGAYTRLLFLQHQKGRLSEKAMLAVCPDRDEIVFEKFVIDDDGNYYNERMEAETQKRKSHCQKQKEKVEKRWDNDTTVIPDEYPGGGDTAALPLEKENDNENNCSFSSQEENKDKPKKKDDSCVEQPPDKKRPVVRHKHGEYGWVKLSGVEYDRLLADYGEAETQKYIAVVDEAAQSTSNKNKWRDWNLTVRRAIRDKWGQSYKPESRDDKIARLVREVNANGAGADS